MRLEYTARHSAAPGHQNQNGWGNDWQQGMHTVIQHGASQNAAIPAPSAPRHNAHPHKSESSEAPTSLQSTMNHLGFSSLVLASWYLLLGSHWVWSG